MHPVATKAPNELGLYDMSGNVYERCQDWYDKNYYSVSPSTNPTGPATGTSRVARSSCWDTMAWGCRVSRRSCYLPWFYDTNRGLRLAM